MNIQTSDKAKIEVYRGDTCIASCESTSFDLGSLPIADIDYCKIIPLQRFKLINNKFNDNLVHITDTDKNEYIVSWIDKDKAKKLIKILNKLNNK